MAEDGEAGRPKVEISPTERRRLWFRRSVEKRRKDQGDLTETGEKFEVDGDLIKQADVMLGNEAEKMYTDAEDLRARIDKAKKKGKDRKAEKLEKKLAKVEEHGLAFSEARSYDADLQGTKMRFYLLNGLSERLLDELPGDLKAKRDDVENAKGVAAREKALRKWNKAVRKLDPDEKKIALGVQRERDDIFAVSKKLDQSMAGRVSWGEKVVDFASGKVDSSTFRRRVIGGVFYGLGRYERSGRKISRAQREVLSGLSPMEAARTMQIEAMDKLNKKVEKDVAEGKVDVETAEVELTEAEKEAAKAAETFMDAGNFSEQEKLISQNPDNYKKKLADVIGDTSLTDEQKFQQISTLFGEIADKVAPGNSDAQRVLQNFLNERMKQGKYVESKQTHMPFLRAFLFAALVEAIDGITDIPGKFAEGVTP